MQGKWSIEDSKRLLHLYAEKGNKWAEIGAALGRHPENTRYKFRELALGEAAVKGKWTPEDEAKLTELVTQYIEERPVGHLPDNPFGICAEQGRVSACTIAGVYLLSPYTLP